MYTKGKVAPTVFFKSKVFENKCQTAKKTSLYRFLYPHKGSLRENPGTKHDRVNHDDVSKSTSIKLLSEC